MGFYLRKSSSKIGTAPGTISYGGAPREEIPSMDAIFYTEEGYTEFEIETLGDLDRHGELLWLNVDGVHDTALLEQIGERFKLHHLGMEDVASTLQRAKVDDFETHMFITVRMIHKRSQPGAFSEQVSIVLGENFVISFQETEGDVFDPIRRRLREGIGRIRRVGTDYLAYTLIDVIVDNYFTVLEEVSDALEALEGEVLIEPPADTLSRLRKLRANLVMIRRAAWPLREVASKLMGEDVTLIQSDTHPYLRDLYDHVVQIIDIVESLRDVSSSIHDLYMASISNRMNEIMKFLTIVGTIFIPLTFIAGIYGMNFVDMPELQWEYGYPAAMGVMAVIGVSLIGYFRYRRWL